MAANLLLASLFKWKNCSEHKVQVSIATQNLPFKKAVGRQLLFISESVELF